MDYDEPRKPVVRIIEEALMKTRKGMKIKNLYDYFHKYDSVRFSNNPQDMQRWKNTLRHTLSINERFMKHEGYWVLATPKQEEEVPQYDSQNGIYYFANKRNADFEFSEMRMPTYERIHDDYFQPHYDSKRAYKEDFDQRRFEPFQQPLQCNFSFYTQESFQKSYEQKTPQQKKGFIKTVLPDINNSSLKMHNMNVYDASMLMQNKRNFDSRDSER